MPLSEADTRAKMIDPALHACGWSEDLIRREETAGTVHYAGGSAFRGRGRVDYTLRVKVHAEAQAVAVALIEAKSEDLPPGHGLDQAKGYADARRLNVPFVFSSNGHQFVEFDAITGITSPPRPLAEFPTPDKLRVRYEVVRGFALDSPGARPLVVPYHGGEANRRYYQDAAIRAVLERIAQGECRALLSLATGAGKTFIAVHLLKRIADAGQLHRALFVCDRDELRTQANGAFQKVFGADAAPVSGSDPAKNARVLIATYQTLDVATDEDGANFLRDHYPENYFSHIIIDECHRSGFGRWREVLDRNPDAVQVGLTATPRQLVYTGEDSAQDEALARDNVRYFGEPAYEYGMGQGIEDGYLAAVEIVRRDIFLDAKPEPEDETGIRPEDLEGKRVTDAITGQHVSPAESRGVYRASTFEADILLPERVDAMCADLFKHLLTTGGPEQKTIIFCARDDHAQRVSDTMNNLYAEWCTRRQQSRKDPYAFKCTAASQGTSQLPDFRGSGAHHFIATTVDLLTTGVDVPAVRNIVFFKYVRSPIAFYQMLGRGTRIDPPSGKLMFRVYDYTNATRLLGADFRQRFTPITEPTPTEEPTDRPDPEHPIRVEGFEVRVTPAGRYILMNDGGRAVSVTVEEYRQMLVERLVTERPTLDAFRACWVDPECRRALLQALPGGEASARLVQELQAMRDYDLYDVLGDAAYGMHARTRDERAEAFSYKHAAWLATLPDRGAAVIRALTRQFARAGTEGLETPEIFATPEVTQAGGLAALRDIGAPADVLRDTKCRLFAA